MAWSLDELDHQIIAELRRDGRLANTEIARRLGVSEATIRNRIQRLTGAGVIQIGAMVNLARLGYEQYVIIGVHCDNHRLLEVAEALAAMPEVRYVSCVTGRYDLVVAGLFASRDELFDFLTKRLGSMPGVGNTETMHLLRPVKRDFDYWEPADSADAPLGRDEGFLRRSPAGDDR
jgi:Lrp/AsnC family transcriptional regulator for asnA, asnC and gidA